MYQGQNNPYQNGGNPYQNTHQQNYVQNYQNVNQQRPIGNFQNMQNNSINYQYMNRQNFGMPYQNTNYQNMRNQYQNMPQYNIPTQNYNYGYQNAYANMPMNQVQNNVIDERKSAVTAGALGVCLGGLGLHSFYLGHNVKGFIQVAISVLTLGVGSLWGFTEGVLILSGKTKMDAKGRSLKE